MTPLTKHQVFEIIGRLEAEIRALGVSRLAVFGSIARGEVRPDSDVDFLVVANDNRPKPKRSAPIYSLLRDYNCSKDILVYTPEEMEEYRETPNSVIHNALKEGLVLYEREV